MLLSSMLSEGSAVLLSRHGASLASEPESFGPGRTFTDMTACPLTGHAYQPAGRRSAETSSTEAPPVRPLASESNTAPAAEAAPAAALKAPVRKPYAVARAAPRYDLPRYAAPRYEPRPYALLRHYGSYGGQEY